MARTAIVPCSLSGLPARRIPRVQISGGALPPDQRLSVWHGSVCLICETATVAAPCHGAEPRLQGWRLANLVLTHCCDDKLALQCRTQPASPRHEDLVRLIRVSAASQTLAHLIFGQALQPLDASALHLVDARRAVITCSVGQSTVFIPYSAIGYDPARHPPYLRIGINTAIGSLLAPTLATLWHELDHAREIDAPILADGFARLVRGLTIETLGTGSIQRPAAGTRRDAIVEYIEEHLVEPTLHITEIERAFDSARSTLFRDFEADGGIERYIRRRRLELAFIELARSELSRGGISRISRGLGFSSPNHFNRVFRAQFGCRPSDVQGKGSPSNSTLPAEVGSREARAKLGIIASWLADIRRH
jgi:AraC-like DNA-binding protein